jgi:hypothetical protein
MVQHVHVEAYASATRRSRRIEQAYIQTKPTGTKRAYVVGAAETKIQNL